MEKRQLGNTDIMVTPLCFGGNVFGWTIDEQTSFKILDKLIEAEVNFIDTANVYSRWAAGNHGGESETIIGKWLKQHGNRDKVIVATKVGMPMADDQKGLAKDYILTSVEDSLRRLQTDYIDLYQSHIDDPATPLAETLAAYQKLIEQGKVRAIGASNYKAERLAESLSVSAEHNLASYQCLQPEYNLFDRADYEQHLAPICREHHLGVISYFSLARGFLSGKYRSAADLNKSVRGQSIQKYLNDRGFRILAALDQVAAQLQASPAQVALAWVIAQPTITAPIASATNEAQFADLIAGANLKLPDNALAQLNQASATEA